MSCGKLYGTVLPRGTSRQISLEIGDPNLLNSVISSITPDDVELQSSQVGSFVVHNHSGGQSTVDLSNFFLRYRLPALQDLSLSGMCRMLTWGCLESPTTRPITPSLKIEETSSPQPRLNYSRSFSLTLTSKTLNYLAVWSPTVECPPLKYHYQT